MSFVIAAPDLVQGAAQDLAGIRASLAEAAASVAGPTTGVVPAAADEVSTAISELFGNFGREFQLLSAQAQAFHSQFVGLMNAGAGAYVSTELTNAEQAATNAISGGGGGAAGATPAAGLLGGLLGGASGGSLVGGLTSTTSGVGGLLGGLTGGPSGVSGLVGGLNGTTGLGGIVGGLGNSLTPSVNSLLPGILNLQIGGGGTGTGFTGIWGPYQALVANTSTNFQSLLAGWLADPFPFLRQVGANWTHYGQIIATSLATGNLQPISAIPGDIMHNASNVVATLTNTSITPHLQILSVLPLEATLDTFVGLPVVAGVALAGAPVATMEAASSSAFAFATALVSGNAPGAIAALIDAPAVIANGFLNGQATLPLALSIGGLPLVGSPLGPLVNVGLNVNVPFDGILHPPGFSLATVTVTSALDPALPPITADVGVGGTPFSGLAPFVVNYAPQQLALAIGAPASPPPLIDLSLFTLGLNGLNGILGTGLGTNVLGGLLGGVAGGTGGLVGGLLGL